MTVSWRYSEGFQTPGLKYFITNEFPLISLAGIYLYQDSEREMIFIRKRKNYCEEFQLTASVEVEPDICSKVLF